MSGLTLSPVVLDDAADLFQVVEAARSDLSKWFIWPDRITDVATATEAIREYLNGTRVKYWWLIRSDGIAVGGIQLRIRDGGRAVSLPYWLVPQARGNGIVTKATAFALTIAKGMGFDRAEFVINEGNAGSLGVAKRLGFRRVGVKEVPFRDSIHKNEVWVLEL